MAYNRIILEGRICSDIELKQTQSGVEYCNFSMAVDRDYKSGEERQTDFITVKAWRGSAKFISQYFHKGDPILIDGRLEVNKYDKDGEARTYTSVVVDRCTFTIGKKSSYDGNNAAPAQTFSELPDDGEDGLPF